ncbi:MAG: hypothetical protein WCZ90_00545 [Melioribacteraceae bacterium]
MKRLIVFVSFLLIVNSVQAQDTVSKPILIMDDGQLRSHPVMVFIENANITKEMNPVLCLVAIDQKTRRISGNVLCKGPSFSPFESAPDQTIAKTVEESQIAAKGTMMLFDLDNLKIPLYASGVRVLPVVTWVAKKVSTAQNNFTVEYFQVISDKEVYIGNGAGGVFWTAIFLVGFFIIIIFLEYIVKRGPLDVMRISETELSLPLVQMALWTVSVGGMVFAFGLMHLNVPTIPTSLVILMGLSAVTSAAGHFQSQMLEEIKDELGKNASAQQVKKRGLFSSLSSLITITVEGKEYPTMAKSQFLFWTIATLILFIYKSSVEGKLWSVPDELIVLMGISQGSYLFRNQMEIKKENNELAAKAGTANNSNP